MKIPQKHYRELYTLFASIHNPEEAEKFLEDMLTPKELDSLAERWQLIQELDSGLPQRDIAEKLHLSISKITRGSRALQYGKGGFRMLLDRLKK
ncbi:MAG: YerC/YecD family TrpR-related protein [bacterium]|nr:YerC/YecD family TrpR-related protein [bacterium]